MNRREFLKSALTIAALAPVTRLAAGTGADGDKTSDAAEGAQVTRRRYKNTALTVPLLGFGCMRLPRLSPDRPDIDQATVKKMIVHCAAIIFGLCLRTRLGETRTGRFPALPLRIASSILRHPPFC